MTAIDEVETCRKGHPYTPENTRIVTIRGQQSRQCRECDKARAQMKRDRLRGDRPKFKKKKLLDTCFRGHPMEGDNLYFYETEWGTQRRCRACENIREEERRARGKTVAPTKTHCIRGHALEGENLSFRPNGYAICRQCSLIRTMKHKNANYDEVLDQKTRNKRKAKSAVNEEAKAKIVAIYAENLPEDELIRRLREVMPPAEK